MKTLENNKQGLPLTKSPPRWAWMAGATAAAAAATPHAHAVTAQISLINNQLDSITGNSLSLQITSGHPFGIVTTTDRNGNGASVQANIVINGHQNHLSAYFRSGAFVVQLGNPDLGIFTQHVGFTSLDPQKAFVLVPFTLTDPNVAGGQANTNALLELEAFNQSVTDSTVVLAVFYPESGNGTPGLTIDSSTGVITGSFSNVGSSNNGVFTPANVPEPSGLGLRPSAPAASSPAGSAAKPRRASAS